MKTPRKIVRAVAALAVVGSVGTASVAVAGAQSTATPTTVTASSQNIVQIAASNPEFSTLVSAVTAAGLGEALSGTGPFTVFAPTNEAFAKIPAPQLQAILADKAQLTKILTYHVIPGKVVAGNLKKKQNVATVEGAKVKIRKSSKGATIGDAKITQTDIPASNGVIHVIDTVLVPPPGM
jgi:uncharacterized surface protein with fasciclin (FAS1) repeats